MSRHRMVTHRKATPRRAADARPASRSSARWLMASPLGVRPLYWRRQVSFFFRGRGLPRRQVARDLFLGAPREHAGGVVLYVPSRRRKFVALFDEEPFLPFPAALHVDQREIAVQLLAVQPEFQIAARQLLRPRNAAQQVERAAVPQHHAARSVVARRDVAFEIAVFDGVVFHVRGEMLHRGVERRPLGHGPRLQHAIHLQPEIVVQPRGIVPLHAKEIAGGLALPVGRRFGRLLETAFGGVFIQRHKSLYLFYLHLIHLCSTLKPARTRRKIMASSVWKGHLTFGLVSFPIRLFSAARSETISFNLLHKDDHSRIKQVTYCQAEDKPILLSIGYGKARLDERLSMNFGPLNKDGGWRRLNVLITRARERCLVFSSIRGEDFDLQATQARGVHSLKGYLEYDRSGKLPEISVGQGEFGSPFEEAVYNALTEQNLELHRQVGCAGFVFNRDEGDSFCRAGTLT